MSGPPLPSKSTNVPTLVRGHDGGGYGRPIIKFTFTPEAGAKFAKLTRDNVGRRFAVVVNNRIIMAPVVREPILGSTGEIDDKFVTESQARAVITEMMGTSR